LNNWQLVTIITFDCYVFSEEWSCQSYIIALHLFLGNQSGTMGKSLVPSLNYGVNTVWLKHQVGLQFKFWAQRMDSYVYGDAEGFVCYL